MSDLRTAAQVALEALRHGVKRLNHRGGTVECLPLHEAITTLRAALVEPQEPDLWGAGYEAGYAAGMAERPAEPVLLEICSELTSENCSSQ